MKKIIPLIMVFIITVLSLVPQPTTTHAIGISGSNAVKNAVINSMEMAGVKFVDKNAKEKAYNAWNMKAYEKWKDDEANGRNADLWATFHGETRKIESQQVQIETLPDKPNFGKMLLDATWFGMAVSIGAEIGFAIEEAQIQNKALYYLQNELVVEPGQTLAPTFGLVQKYRSVGGDFKTNVDLYNSAGEIVVGGFSSVLENDPSLSIHIIDAVYNKRSGSYPASYKLTLLKTSRGTDGILKTATVTQTVNVSKMDVHPLRSNDGGFIVESIPKPEQVPTIVPNPYIEPLITPNPDISNIPSIIPQIETVPVILPISEPLIDNPYIEPYTPVGVPQPENPDNPDLPDKPLDPNNPWNPSYPGNPSSPTDPVKPTYPGKDKPVEEKPEYPGETTATETPGLFSKLWEWLKSILDVLFKILSAIIMLPFTLLEMLWDFLIDLATALFVPSDGYWDGNIAKLKKLLWAEEIDELQDGFEDLGGGGSGGSFKDVIVDIMGVANVTVIDADSINSILDTIHKWVRGVIYPLILLFNINSLYKMIRGTSLMEITRSARYKED